MSRSADLGQGRLRSFGEAIRQVPGEGVAGCLTCRTDARAIVLIGLAIHAITIVLPALLEIAARPFR